MSQAANAYQTPRVLVVDDDGELCEQIAVYLSNQGFLVEVANDSGEMDAILRRHMADVVVLDLMLPGEDGLSICARLKGPNRPSIVMLSAVGEDNDRIAGLDLGADDYLAKPCAPRELLARIRAVLRHKWRPEAGAQRPNVGYGFRGFRLDIWRRQLQAPNGVAVLLTAGEFSLLQAFLERPNRVLTRDELLDAARGGEVEVFDRAIDVQLSRLRRKLAAGTDREIIRTLRGAGYLFDGVVTRL